jgi:hypothetical protein
MVDLPSDVSLQFVPSKSEILTCSTLICLLFNVIGLTKL